MNLKAFNDADVDVLRRLIVRERQSYSSIPRNLMPVPRKKIEYRPPSPLVWIALTEPLYPATTSGTPVNQATGYVCEYDETNQRWQPIYPYQEVTVEAASFNIAAPVWSVIACQKHGDVYEAVAGAPLEESTFSGFDGTRSGHGWTNYFGTYGLENTTSITSVEASGWLYPTRRTARFYNGLYQADGIQLDTSATTPSTNGNFDCNHTGHYEISVEVSGLTTIAWTGTPADNPRGIQTENTGPASAGTSHTHTYDHYYPAHYEPMAVSARLWIKEGAGAYTDQSFTDGKQFFSDDIAVQGRASVYNGRFNYFSRAYANFTAGDRIGIEFRVYDLIAARIGITNLHINFRPMDLYTRSGLGAG